MTAQNLIFPENLVLDPMLEIAVRKLNQDKPNWFFRPSYTGVGDNYKGSVDNKIAAPDGTRFVRDLVVVQDNREAGRIGVERMYRRSHSEQYFVDSKRIENGRKGRKMTSTKVDVIVRQAKKFFEPPKNSEIMYEEMQETVYRLDQVLGDLVAPFRNGTGVRTRLADLQIAMHNTFKGLHVVNPELRDVLLSKEFEEAMSKYLLGQQMRQRSYKFIHYLDGDYCFFADEAGKIGSEEAAAKAEVVAKSFDELPTDWQEKLAVLQLMQDREIVLDVGFRYSNNSFLVTVVA